MTCSIIPSSQARPGCLPQATLSLLQENLEKNSGAMRTRTANLLRARQALSQLSYSPKKIVNRQLSIDNYSVGLGGIEPPTSRLSGVRSNHLSYRPIMSTIIK